MTGNKNKNKKGKYICTDRRDGSGHGRIEVLIALDHATATLLASSVVGLFHEIAPANVVAAPARFVHHFLCVCV